MPSPEPGLAGKRASGRGRMGIGARLALGRFYLSLSRPGRRYVRGAARRRLTSRGGNAALYSAILNDRRRRADLLRSFRVCDALFARAVPAKICREAGRDRFAVYLRFVPFAWLNVVVRSRYLEAFGAAVDRAAIERGALFSFLHREINDLGDREPESRLRAAVGRLDADSEGLPRAIREIRRSWRAEDGDGGSPSPAPAILSRLLRLKDEMLPRDIHEAYGVLMTGLLALPKGPDPNDRTGPVREAGVASVVRLGLRVMAGALPPGADEAVAPFSAWYYGVDEIADADRDIARGVKTRMTEAPDREALLAELFARAEAAISATARDPERILFLMRLLNDRVVAARRSGRDVERELFHPES